MLGGGKSSFTPTKKGGGGAENVYLVMLIGWGRQHVVR